MALISRKSPYGEDMSEESALMLPFVGVSGKCRPICKVLIRSDDECNSCVVIN